MCGIYVRCVAIIISVSMLEHERVFEGLPNSRIPREVTGGLRSRIHTVDVNAGRLASDPPSKN